MAQTWEYCNKQANSGGIANYLLFISRSVPGGQYLRVGYGEKSKFLIIPTIQSKILHHQNLSITTFINRPTMLNRWVLIFAFMLFVGIWPNPSAHADGLFAFSPYRGGFAHPSAGKLLLFFYLCSIFSNCPFSLIF